MCLLIFSINNVPVVDFDGMNYSLTIVTDENFAISSIQTTDQFYFNIHV